MSDSSEGNFEKKLDSNGKENPKYVDLLEEDKPLANQKFVCMSFVSPDKILKQRNEFMFEEFVKTWDLSKSLEKFSQFLNFISYKYNLTNTDVAKDLEEFVKEESITLGKTSITDEFKTFMDKNEDKLEAKFNTEHNFQTSVNGVKVRGTFPSQEEAEFRAKKLREIDENFDVYVGPVGMWMPWEPDAYKTGRVEYLEDELNQLMHKKKENEDEAKDYFNARVKEAKINAIEENKKLAAKSGNKLTQNVTKDGELVGVSNMNTQERDLLANKEEVTSADIKKELFEGENVLTEAQTKVSDHGLSQIEGITLDINSSDITAEDKAFLKSINQGDGVEESKGE